MCCFTLNNKSQYLPQILQTHLSLHRSNISIRLYLLISVLNEALPRLDTTLGCTKLLPVEMVDTMLYVGLKVSK